MGGDAPPGIFIETVEERRLQRMLIIAGAILLITGLLWPLITRLGLGRLPGDIVIRREGFQFYFPIVTCILLSVVLSLLTWLFRR